MLTAADFIRANLKRLHKGLDKALAELTPEQLHTVPAGHPKANTIGWGIWHYVRTEDNIVRWVIQDRRPPIWTESGYGQKLGLPPAAQEIDDRAPHYRRLYERRRARLGEDEAQAN